MNFKVLLLCFFALILSGCLRQGDDLDLKKSVGEEPSAGEEPSECTAESSTECFDGNVYWVDSCGVRGEVQANCNNGGKLRR